ncbi:MAG: ABC transporter ATP-binding protein [Eubacterium sp.]|nr:ABC transporter ATP-binding protein [Eubacterium sp.]
MIEIKDMEFRYGSVTKKEKKFEVKDASLKLEKGYISCLLGKNGAGKTTLLSLMYGMLKPKKGELLWDGKPVTKNNLTEYRQNVAYIGEAWCLQGLTVDHNIEMLSGFYPSFDKTYFDSLMKLAGADRVRESLFGKLSKGEKVKVEIAFALARRPKYVILDEPLANIDPVFKIDILDILQKGVSDNEIGILLSTHLLDEISDMVDYINVMEDGRITTSGTRFEVLGEDGNAQLRDVFRK